MSDLGPELPGNWYLVGPASGLKPGAVTSIDIGPLSLVLWRGAGGRAQAFAGHCAHMGCHLGGASVVGETLRCPLHHRLIAADGRFGDGTLVQPVFPVREAYGCLFIGVGDVVATAPAPLDESAWATCYAGEHRFPLTWQVLVANGFDVEHLSSVHHRKLLEPPVLAPLGEAGMQLTYRTRPTGPTLQDHVIGWLAPDGVVGSISCFSGTMMLVESTLGRRRSFILLSFVPGRQGETTIRGIVGVQAASRWLGSLSARIAALLFKGFLNKDLGVLDRLDWHEPAASAALGDRFTRQLCAYFRTLAHA